MSVGGCTFLNFLLFYFSFFLLFFLIGMICHPYERAANAQTNSAQVAANAQNQSAASGIGLTGMALGGATAAGLFSGAGGADPLMSGGDLTTTLSGASAADSMSWIDYAAAL
jgi:hypothetical protein